MSILRTRLAPTPSGFLHIGNAVSFVVTWALARSHNGWVLLRIDDLDASRRRPEYLEDIFRTVEWLGLDYDAGPAGPDDFLKNYSQHCRLELYREALQQLKEKELLYACTCSRREIQLLNADGKYPGTCREQNKDLIANQSAWRIPAPQHPICFQEWKKGKACLDLAQAMGDFVVKQKNGLPAYQIASLLDDEYWKINFIVRGEDLRPSTAAQMYLAQKLGFSGFPETTFWHHGIITDEEGNKLSKSLGAEAIKHWREQGKSPAPIFKMAADWLGLEDHQWTNPADLVSALPHQSPR